MDELIDIVEKFKGRESSLIEILFEIQEKKGYIPREDVFRLSEILKIPVSSILRLVTFYRTFRLTQRPRKEIKICVGAPCYLKGGRELIEKLEKILGIKLGEESLYGEIGLSPMECKGRCAIGPLIEIDGKILSGSELDDLEEKIGEEFKGSKDAESGI